MFRIFEEIVSIDVWGLFLSTISLVDIYQFWKTLKESRRLNIVWAKCEGLTNNFHVIYRVGVRYVSCSTVLTKLYFVRAALSSGKMRNYSEPWFLKHALKTFYFLLTFLGKTANLGWLFCHKPHMIQEIFDL